MNIVKILSQSDSRRWIVVFYGINAALCLWVNLLGFVLNPVLTESFNLSWYDNLSILLFNLCSSVSFIGAYLLTPCLLFIILSYTSLSKHIVYGLAMMVAFLFTAIFFLDIWYYHLYHTHGLFQWIFTFQPINLSKWLDMLKVSYVELILVAMVVMALEYYFIQWGILFFIKDLRWQKWVVVTALTIVLALGAVVLWYYGHISTNKLRSKKQSAYFYVLNHSIDQVPLVPSLLSMIFKDKLTLHWQQEKDLSTIFDGGNEYQPLNYPTSTHSWPKKNTSHYNVVLVVVNALRFDMVTPSIMPHLSRLASNSWQFMAHYSGGNFQRPGVFSMMYSVPSTYRKNFFREHRAPILFKAFAENGYRINLVSSEYVDFLPGHFRQEDALVSQHLHIISPDTDFTDSNDKASLTALLQTMPPSQKNKKPFFDIMMLNGVNQWCALSSPSQDEAMSEPSFCNRLALTKDSHSDDYIKLYQHALQEDDYLIDRLHEKMRAKGLLNNTVIIITSSSGQEFNDSRNGVWGDGVSFDSFQVQVPLIIHWPHSKPQQVTRITSHYDIAPTLLQHVLGLMEQASTYSVGKALDEDVASTFSVVVSQSSLGLMNENSVSALYNVDGFMYSLQASLKKGQGIQSSEMNKAIHDMVRFYKKNSEDKKVAL